MTRLAADPCAHRGVKQTKATGHVLAQNIRPRFLGCLKLSSNISITGSDTDGSARETKYSNQSINTKIGRTTW